jgi:hypothetical protein
LGTGGAANRGRISPFSGSCRSGRADGRHDREGFSFREGFPSNKLQILRDHAGRAHGTGTGRKIAGYVRFACRT